MLSLCNVPLVSADRLAKGGAVMEPVYDKALTFETMRVIADARQNALDRIAGIVANDVDSFEEGALWMTELELELAECEEVSRAMKG